MNENTPKEVNDPKKEFSLWEYKWSGGDLEEMNRLGRQGWEAVGTNASTQALVFGATTSTVVRVLYKRPFYGRVGGENEAGIRLKQMLEQDRARKDVRN
jgi:hypothetical protein